MATRNNAVDGTTLNQKFGYAFGGIYLLVGVLGFFVTGGDVGFAATEGELLFNIFEVNPLHNIVHLVIGAALVWGAAAGPLRSRTTNLSVGVVYLAVAVIGPFLTGTEANILALNVADHWLHAITGALAVGVAMAETRQPVRQRS